MPKVHHLKGKLSNNSCEVRLTPCQEEVLTMFLKCGETQTMAYYNVKTRRTFRQWLRNHWKPAPITNMLSKLSGGRKLQWLRNHRDLVLGICESNNDEVAISLFSITPDQLVNIKRFQPMPARPTFRTASDKADYAISQVESLIKVVDTLKGIGDVTDAKVSELREQQNNIITGLNNIYDGIVERLKPVLVAAMANTLPAMKLECPDPLNVEIITREARQSERLDNQIAILRAKLAKLEDSQHHTIESPIEPEVECVS